MEASHWLTLTASLVALLSVLVTFLISKRQIASANALAVKQIEAAAEESRRKLRTETVVEDRRKWIEEFKRTINDILYYGYPDLDSNSELSLVERQCNITKSALKIDLMMPVGKEHADLISSVAFYSQFLIDGNLEDAKSERMNAAAQITTFARNTVREQLRLIEDEYSTDE